MPLILNPFYLFRVTFLSLSRLCNRLFAKTSFEYLFCGQLKNPVSSVPFFPLVSSSISFHQHLNNGV